MSRVFLVRLGIASIALSSLGFGGCGEEAPTAPPAPLEEGSAIETDLIDPTAVVVSHALAITSKDLRAYRALLDSDFEFLPLSPAAFWLESEAESWGKTEELRMIERLFDESYLKAFENEVVLEGAEAIQFDATILDLRTDVDGRTEVTCGCQGFVLTTPTLGWSFRIRLVFTLVSRDGFLRIQKIVESEDPGFPRSTSWGRIKGYYN